MCNIGVQPILGLGAMLIVFQFTLIFLAGLCLEQQRFEAQKLATVIVACKNDSACRPEKRNIDWI